MASTTKRLCKGTLTTSNAPLYTSPTVTGGYTIIKAITLCNITASDATITIKFAGTEVLYQKTIPAKDMRTIPFMDQIINTTELIEGLASAGSSITYYISGKEVS